MIELTKDLVKGLQCKGCGCFFCALDKRQLYCSKQCNNRYRALAYYHKKMASNDVVWKEKIKLADKEKGNKRRQSVEYREWFRKYEVSYREKNRPLYRAKDAKRRAIELKACPNWANLEIIKDVYKEAAYFGYHVDHIIPLQGKTVCGLHVWDNLQLLSETDNKRKGNSFDYRTE